MAILDKIKVKRRIHIMTIHEMAEITIQFAALKIYH